MTLPTANVRIETGPVGLFAKSRYFDPPLEGCPQRAGDFPMQVHELARIGPVDGWDRAGAAKVTTPGRTKEAALLTVAAAIIVAVEIFTFTTGRCFHNPTIKESE